MTNQISITAKKWNALDREDKLEMIQETIEDYSVSEGFLMLRYFRKSDYVRGYIQTSLDNHLCLEAVSQATLIELFGEDHNYTEEDAETILNWMEKQN